MRNVPFTVDELLAYTFLPHDATTTMLANEGTCILKMTLDGVLMKLVVEDGVNISEMSNEEWEAFEKANQFGWIDV